VGRDGHDLIIVGAGVFGVSTAREAARRGLGVLVLERSRLPNPAAASTGPSRKIRSTYENAAYSGLVIDAMAEWDRLQRDAGESLYLRLGNLVYTTADSHPTLDTFQAASERGGGTIERLGPAELRARFPQFRLARQATFERDAGVIRATAATEALRREAVDAGATIREAASVVHLDLDGPEPVVVLDDGERLKAARIVVAAGAWTSRLVPALGATITLKRQGLAYLPDLPGWFDQDSLSPFSELDNVFYGFPRIGDDPVKIGWHIYGEVTDDPDVDRDHAPQRFLDGVVTFLREHFGIEMEQDRIVGASCLYDLTPTWDFVIDFIPGSACVLVATGGSGHSYKFGSVIGRVIMDRLDGVSGSWFPELSWDHVTGRRSVAS
jgi:sarcosine oxidase